MKPDKSKRFQPPSGGGEVFSMRDAGPPEINLVAWEAAKAEARRDRLNPENETKGENPAQDGSTS